MRIAVLDIGGTFIKSAVYEHGKLHSVRETARPEPAGGRETMDCAKAILKGYGDFDAIGVSCSGQIDTERGTVRGGLGPDNGFVGTEIRKILQEAFGVPVTVDNDVNAAAVGEAYFGAGRDQKDFLCITYGTGVGGAIVLDRKVYRGSCFSAGEFGLMVTRRKGQGGFPAGIYNDIASTRALVERVRDYNPAFENGRLIFQHLDDPAIKEIVDDWTGEVLTGLANLIHIFNPPCVILGGGVMEQPYLLHEIRRRLPDYVMDSFLNVVICQAETGNQAGMFGAAAEVMELSGRMELA